MSLASRQSGKKINSSSSIEMISSGRKILVKSDYMSLLLISRFAEGHKSFLLRLGFIDLAALLVSNFRNHCAGNLENTTKFDRWQMYFTKAGSRENRKGYISRGFLVSIPQHTFVILSSL